MKETPFETIVEAGRGKEDLLPRGKTKRRAPDSDMMPPAQRVAHIRLLEGKVIGSSIAEIRSDRRDRIRRLVQAARAASTSRETLGLEGSVHPAFWKASTRAASFDATRSRLTGSTFVPIRLSTRGSNPGWR